MIVRFWGVRGATPTPATNNVKYGGNTPCVEVRTAAGQLIILDAGTGIRSLGQVLMRQAPPKGHRIMLFFSHYHWDHIQGIPFFEPMYVPSNFIYLHGFTTPDASIEKVLSDQMMAPFFPVDLSVMRATRNFYSVGEETLQLGDAVITTRALQHPQGCLGYRIEADGQTVVYATDHECGSAVHDRNLLELADQADVFMMDTQYTSEEYPSKKGWGHSTWRDAVRICKEANVKLLVLFHHDPDHSDVFMDNLVLQAGREFGSVIGAMEGMELDPSQSAEGTSYRPAFHKRYLDRYPVSIPATVTISSGTVAQQVLLENLSLDGSYFLTPTEVSLGQEIEFQLRFPGTDPNQPTKCQVRVVRVEKVGNQFGVGVSFRMA
jgi:phosphoribosyl 1,2-cyclic phosphodiesterase